MKVAWRYLLSLKNDSIIESPVIRIDNEKLNKIVIVFITVQFSGKVCLEKVCIKICN